MCAECTHYDYSLPPLPLHHFPRLLLLLIPSLTLLAYYYITVLQLYHYCTILQYYGNTTADIFCQYQVVDKHWVEMRPPAVATTSDITHTFSRFMALL